MVTVLLTCGVRKQTPSRRHSGNCVSLSPYIYITNSLTFARLLFRRGVPMFYVTNYYDATAALYKLLMRLGLTHQLPVLELRFEDERWPHPFGQSSEIFKWNVRGSHAANLIAGSVAKYASSGVRSSRLE
jgi:hypothetical protein